MSREVAAMGSVGRETARLRASQIDMLVDLTREARASGAPARAPAAKAAPEEKPAASREKPEAAPESAPQEMLEKTPIPAPPARRRGLEVPLALGVLLVTGVIVVVYIQMHRPTPAPASTAPGPVTATATAPAPTLVATAAPSAASPPTPAADIQARQTLERLRSGLDVCIRTRIHALPGSSPPVPPTLLQLKEGAYTSAPGDWKTPVWSCAQLQMSEPMQFQLQWQHVNPSAEGAGIAWIDQDHDGVADRALGFSVTLAASGAPILGEIHPVAATTPLIATPR